MDLANGENMNYALIVKRLVYLDTALRVQLFSGNVGAVEGVSVFGA